MPGRNLQKAVTYLSEEERMCNVTMSPVGQGDGETVETGQTGGLWFQDTQHHASVSPLEEWKLSFPWGH